MRLSKFFIDRLCLTPVVYVPIRNVAKRVTRAGLAHQHA